MPSRRRLPRPPAWAADAEPPWLGLERPHDGCPTHIKSLAVAGDPVGDDTGQVAAEQREPLPAAGAARRGSRANDGERRAAHRRRSRPGGRRAAAPRPTRPERSATTGATKTATCVDDETAISAPSPELPRRAVTIAPPCSVAFPTSATMTAATKNWLRPRLLDERRRASRRARPTRTRSRRVATMSAAIPARRLHGSPGRAVDGGAGCGRAGCASSSRRRARAARRATGSVRR